MARNKQYIISLCLNVTLKSLYILSMYIVIVHTQYRLCQKITSDIMPNFKRTRFLCKHTQYKYFTINRRSNKPSGCAMISPIYFLQVFDKLSRVETGCLWLVYYIQNSLSIKFYVQNHAAYTLVYRWFYAIFDDWKLYLKKTFLRYNFMERQL